MLTTAYNVLRIKKHLIFLTFFFILDHKCRMQRAVVQFKKAKKKKKNNQTPSITGIMKQKMSLNCV